MKSDVLVVAAHSDDEVLGCGGTVAKLSSEGADVSVMFMTNGISSRRNVDILKAADNRIIHSKNAAKILGIKHVVQLDFPDNSLDTIPLIQIIQEIERVVDDVRPHTIFTHYLNDLNIDHALVAEATLTATRPMSHCTVKKVLGYEVNSSTEWAFGRQVFAPNYFVNVSDTFQQKVDAMCAYKEELRIAPHPRSVEGINALASLRGINTLKRFKCIDF